MQDIFTVAERSSAHLPLDVLAGLVAIGLLPLFFVMCSSFVRIVVVLSLVRSAIGASALPPNALITGLAAVLTLVTMSPTLARIQKEAIRPYSHGKLSASQTVERASVPLRDFMLRQTRTKDIELFERAGHQRHAVGKAAPFEILVPAFLVGELRSAFAIGFALYLPFVAIDLAVAGILMGLGMMMLSPPVVSLPIKLLLFVLVDGWALVCSGVVGSFR